MRARVSARLNEGRSGPVFYPAAEINAALNEGNRTFVWLTLGLEYTASWTVAPGTTFFRLLPVFPDLITILRITTSTGARVRPASLTELASLASGWIAAPGTPQRYCARGADLVALYKQPTAETTLNVTYAQAPAALVSDADTPAIPVEYHPRLVDYAIPRMRQTEGAQEFKKSLKYFKEFLDGAQKYGDYVRARNLASRYDQVPFELANFDRSTLLKLRPDLPPGRKVSDS